MRLPWRKRRVAPVLSHERRFVNQLFARETPAEEHRGVLLELSALLVAAVALLGVVLLSSLVFSIATISVSGASRLSADRIIASARDAISSQRFASIIPRDNLLLVSEKGIAASLRDAYALSDVRITRHWPNGLRVQIVEALPLLIVTASDGRAFFVTREGSIADQVADDVAGEGYPRLALPVALTLKAHDQLLTSAFAQGVAELSRELSARSISARAFVAVLNTCDKPEALEPESLGEGAAETTNAVLQEKTPPPCTAAMQVDGLADVRVDRETGPALIITTERSVASQLDKYQRFQGTESARSAREYVDLRIPDRLYFR